VALFAGAANARLAVFVGTTGADYLFRGLSGSIPRIHDLGANYDVTAWRRLAHTLFKQYAEPLSVCPNHFAMSGRRLTVDRQLKNTR
jgi:hypothetical protein